MGKSRYRGYARRTGFNPIQLPDESQKILSEGERLLRGMDRAEDQRRQQAQSTNEWLNAKAKVEANDRQQNFDLTNMYADEFRKQTEKNIKRDLESDDIKIKDAQLKSERRSAKKDFLMKMAPSLLKAGTEVAEIQQQKLYDRVRTDMINSGLTPEEQRTIAFTDFSTKQGEAAFNEIKNKLEGRLSPEEIIQLKQLSGREKWARQKYYAQNFGSSEWIRQWNAPEWYLKPFKFPDGRELTPQQVEGGLGTTQDYYVLKQAFEEDLYGKLDTGHLLLASESKPFIDRHVDTIVKKIETANQKKTITNDYQSNRTNLLSSIKTQGEKDPGGEWLGWVERQAATSGSKKYWTEYSFEILADAAKSGEFPLHDWEAIKAQQVTIDGQKSSKPVSEIFRKKAAVVDEAFVAFDTKKRKAWEENYKNFSSESLRAVGEFYQVEGRHMTDDEVDRLRSKFKIWGKEPEWLTNYRSQQQVEIEQGDIYLKRKADKGELSYIELAGSRKYNKVLIDRYADQTYDGPNSFDSKGTEQGIRTAVQTHLGDLIPNNERGREATTMGDLAVDIWRERVNKALAGKAYSSPREAFIQESIVLSREIADGNGIWELKKNLLGDPIRGIKGGFKYLDPKYSREFDTASIAYERAAKDDKVGFLSKPGTIDKEDIQSLKDIASGGEFPNFVGVLANRVYTNKGHYEIVNGLLKANGEDEIEPPGIARTENYVSENYKRLIHNRPSLSKTLEAVTQTTRQLNPGTDEDEPVLNLTKRKEAVAKGGENFVRDKSGRTNTVDISTYSIGDVYNTYRVGNGVEFGVYQFTGQEIGEALDKGIINSADIFDQATQETLEIERYESTGEIKVDNFTVPGIGQAWVVPEVTTSQAMREVFEGLIVEPTKELLAEERTNPGSDAAKAVINKLKDPTTKAFFKRLGNTVAQPVKDAWNEEKTNMGTELAKSTKEDIQSLAELFLGAMAEVDQQMKDYAINRRVRRISPIDPNTIFSQRSINPYKFKPELYVDFNGGNQ